MKDVFKNPYKFKGLLIKTKFIATSKRSGAKIKATSEMFPSILYGFHLDPKLPKESDSKSGVDYLLYIVQHYCATYDIEPKQVHWSYDAQGDNHYFIVSNVGGDNV